MEQNILDKPKLISELRGIHNELVNLYNEIFNYKFTNNKEFSDYIKEQYNQNSINSKDQKVWNENFCHRASYTLLNKILFVRICEDKGFMRNPEDYVAGEIENPYIGEKLSKRGLQKWASIITNSTFGELINFAFLDMKKSYSNIVLYKDNKYEILNPTDEELDLKYIEGDQDTKKNVLEFEKILGDIFEKLDTEKFDFKETDSNILGDVYEQFMDRETRKAIGQFYTPEFVIEYILNNTVSEADVIENPFVTVADISCGSGHFLIMAYDILREKFINNLKKLRDKYSDETYEIKKGGKEECISGKEYWVKENIHYHLLKHCIYGADIDSFAIQLTTINLLLKDLDNFTDELNIIECDSLIKWEDDYDWEDLKNQLEEEFEIKKYVTEDLFGNKELIERKEVRKEFNVKYINPVMVTENRSISRDQAEKLIEIGQFWNKQFNYIVGNPPYITVGGKYTELLDNRYEEYLNFNYKYSNYKMNTYILFYERAINKVKEHGKISFITPKSILDNYYFEEFRKFLTSNVTIESIIEIKNKIFDSAEVGGNAIIVIKDTNLKEYEVELAQINDIEEFNNINSILFKNSVKSFRENPNYKFLLNETDKTELLNKIKLHTLPLGDICEIKNGVNTGNVADILLSSEKKDDRYIPIIEGKDISRYSTTWGGLYICYDNELREKIDITQLKTKQKKIDFALRNKEIFDRPKIVIRQTGDKLIADLDLDKMITRHSVHTIAVNNQYKNKIPFYYILSLLNSELINFYYQSIIPEKGKAFAEVKIVNLNQLPIKTSDTDKIYIIAEYAKKLKELFSQKIDLQNSIYNIFSNLDLDILKKHLDSQAKIEGEIEIYCEIINILIYDLYNIKIEEVKHIKEKSNTKLYNEFEKMYATSTIENAHEIFASSIIELKSNISSEEFYERHILDNMSLKEVSDFYGYSLYTVGTIRENFSKIKDNKLDLYNLSDLIITTYGYLGSLLKEILKDINIFIKLDDITDSIHVRYKNSYKIIDLIRMSNPTKNSITIIKEVLNSDAFTWNAYRKAKKSDKVNKTFIKYYDSNYYGLAEWADEIHKQYFMDVIEEYTITKPNEKKAKDILKLFKDLDIMDKQDYIEIIESKINRAFK